MEAQTAATSILASLDSLLMVLGDDVGERLFNIEKHQPGSIQRSLLRTRGRLTGKLEHRDNAHLRVMMLGPVADSLARRIDQIADPESGVLSVVDFRLNRVSQSLRESALAARGRVATQLNQAQILNASRTSLRTTHAGLMGRLSGDVVLDQYLRREISEVENQLAATHHEENQILEALRNEADALRQGIDAAVQMLGGYVRLGLVSRSASEIQQPKSIHEISKMSPQEVAKWWAELPDSKKMEYLENYPLEIGNLDGIPPQVRLDTHKKYLLERSRRDEQFRAELIAEGLMRQDGSLRDVYFFDPNWPKSQRSIVVFGECQGWDVVNVVFEGTNSGPGTGPGGMEALEKMHALETWKDIDAKKGCIRSFLVREENANWGGVDDWAGLLGRLTPDVRNLLTVGNLDDKAAFLRNLPFFDSLVPRNTNVGVGLVEGIRANGGAETIVVTGHSWGGKPAASVGQKVGADIYIFLETAPLGDLYQPKEGAIVFDIHTTSSTYAGDLLPVELDNILGTLIPQYGMKKIVDYLKEELASDFLAVVKDLEEKDGVTLHRPRLPSDQDGYRSGPWEAPEGLDHSFQTFFENYNHRVTYRSAVRGQRAPDF